MTPRRFGPFDTTSFMAGLLTATPLLLVAAFFIGGTANPSGSIAATLAVSGLALGAIAAAVFVASTIASHLTSANDKENPR